MNVNKLIVRGTYILIIALVGLPIAVSAQAGVPVNDAFGNATAIEGLPFYDVGDNSWATTEDGEPSAHCFWEGTITRTVWYRYTPSGDQTLKAEIRGYGYISMGVYTGADLTDLTEISCYDYTASQLYFQVQAGETYYFQVGSDLDWWYGSYTISLSEIVIPENDSIESARLIEGIPFSSSGDTMRATFEEGEPNPTCGGISHTVWYRYTPAENLAFAVYSEGYYNRVLAAYISNGSGEYTELGCRSMGDPGPLTLLAEAGKTYYLQLGGVAEWDYGAYSISLVQIGIPANDSLLNAQPIDYLPFWSPGSNEWATIEVEEPVSTCHEGSAAARTVWYRYTPVENQVVSTQVNGAPNVIVAVYTRNEFEDLEEVGCSRYGEELIYQVESGRSYYIQLGSIDDWYYGEYTIDIFEIEVPTHDLFSSAQSIEDLPYSSSGSNRWATAGELEPLPSCRWGPVYRSVWYRYAETDGRALTALFESAGGILAVYTGSDLADLTEVACGYSGPFTFEAEAGQTYYFQLTSWGEWGYGDYTFQLTIPPQPYADFSYWPQDPNKYDHVTFCSNAYDPAGMGVTDTWWGFQGDDSVWSGWCVSRQYQNDGDYLVTHTVLTVDGRQASTTKTIAVRTYDVAITKVTVPQTGRVNQTRPISIYLRNNLYPVTVNVDLYKSTPHGFVWIDSITQPVPVKSGSRTTEFSFNYTFTPEDAQVGKVTFKAAANLWDFRDALPADNEYISLPVKVSK